MTGSGPGPIDYQAISKYQHARWAEIRQHTEELGERAAKMVDEQARDILNAAGEETLRRAAAFRADKWRRNADRTAYPANREHYLAKSEAWRAVADRFNDNGTGA